jgi:hypothetical protein
VREAIRAARNGADGSTATLNRVTLRSLPAGRSIQMMHVGPYDREQPTIERIEEYARGEHLRVRGPHREIELSDLRRAKPERLRTIIRYGVG